MTCGTPLLFLGGDVDGLCQEAVDWGGWSALSQIRIPMLLVRASRSVLLLTSVPLAKQKLDASS